MILSCSKIRSWVLRIGGVTVLGQTIDLCGQRSRRAKESETRRTRCDEGPINRQAFDCRSSPHLSERRSRIWIFLSIQNHVIAHLENCFIVGITRFLEVDRNARSFAANSCTFAFADSNPYCCDWDSLLVLRNLVISELAICRSEDGVTLNRNMLKSNLFIS